jgi:hypothetical protein
MKKIVIDGVIYHIKNKEFKKLESLVASIQTAPTDEELEYYRKYIEYCENVKSKYGDGIPVDGVYSTNG